MNVLANDGISQEGVEKLTAAGFNTILESVKQENKCANTSSATEIDDAAGVLIT